MKQCARVLSIAVVAGAMLGLSASADPQGKGKGNTPPNWKGNATGSTVLDEFYVDGDGVFHRVDVDTFGGKSSHLGKFTGAGSHDLNLTTFAFVGYATWTASNGDTLDVTYQGQLFPPSGPAGDPPFPFGAYPFEFVATLQVVGGTGRFADAQGQANWSGAFSGDGTLIPVPVANVFYFDFEGTLLPNGN